VAFATAALDGAGKKTLFVAVEAAAAEVFEPFRLYFLGLLLLGFIFWGKANFK